MKYSKIIIVIAAACVPLLALLHLSAKNVETEVQTKEPDDIVDLFVIPKLSSSRQRIFYKCFINDLCIQTFMASQPMMVPSSSIPPEKRGRKRYCIYSILEPARTKR